MITRLQQASVLTPAIFILMAWVFFMSPLATLDNAPRMLSVAAVLSLTVAYSITLFISFLAKSAKGKP